MARLIVALVLALASGAALADPISLIASAIVWIGGFTGIQALAILAIGSLLSVSDARRKARAAADRQRSAYNASLQDRNVTVLRNDSPWQVVYGSPAPIGGSLVAMFTSGSQDQYKHLVIVFAAHECVGIDELYIEGDAVGTLDASGWATAGTFFETAGDATATESVVFTGTTGTLSRVPLGIVSAVIRSGSGGPEGDITEAVYTVTSNGTTTLTLVNASNLTVQVSYTYNTSTAYVNVQKHLSPGGVDTADAFLISAVPTLWTAAHKLTGYTYAVVTLNLNMARFQGGPPNISAKLRGKKLYDYRTATTIYSTNPALAVADFLRADYGFAATTAQIDSAAAIAAANDCDAQGFNCNGALSTDDSRDSTLQALEDCMAGRTHWSAGVWRIMAGAWASPVLALTDAYLAAPIEVTQAGNPRAQRFNSVRGKYAAAAGLGVVADFTPYTVASYITADGFSQWLDTAYPFTGTNAECQKLAAIAVERSRAGLTLTYPAHLSAWKLQPGDRVSVTNAELGFAAKTFRLQDWTHVNSAPLGLVLVEDVASMYTGTFSAVDNLGLTSNLQDPWARPPAPTGLLASSGDTTLIRNSDGSITARVLVTWTASALRAVLQGGYAQLQWRFATATDDQWISTDVAASATSMYLTGLKGGTNILVRMRFITGVGALGFWATVAHTVRAKTAAPSAPTNLTLSSTQAFWSGITDSDLDGYYVRFQAGGSGLWGQGTALHDGVVKSSPFTFNRKFYGVNTIMVAARDTSGNISAVISATADFGTADGSNVVQTYDYQANSFPGTYTTCSISGGNLVADVSAANDVYALADDYSQADLYSTLYTAMQWVSQTFVPRYGGGTLTLDSTIAGGTVLIEYQIDGSITNDAYALADAYAATDLYGVNSANSAWQTWPGALAVNRMQGINFRVSVAAGATRGSISVFKPNLTLPEARQTFSSQTIDSAGTRLAPSEGTPARSWVLIKTVQITPVVDGSGAIAGRVLDFSTALGPLTQLVNRSATAVTGLATIDIGGLADV